MGFEEEDSGIDRDSGLPSLLLSSGGFQGASFEDVVVFVAEFSGCQ
jgi:hypothetical protein